MVDKFRISVAKVAKTVGLKTPTLHAVTAEVTEWNNSKNLKKNAVYFQPEDNHKTSIAKTEKVKMGQVVIPGNFKRRYKRSPYDSGVLFYWLTVLTCIFLNRPVMS